MVTEFEAGIDPKTEGLDSVVDLAELVQLSLVDESHGGHMPVAEGGDQLLGHSRISCPFMKLPTAAGRSSKVSAIVRREEEVCPRVSADESGKKTQNSLCTPFPAVN
jgi:hypothetical protein